MGSPGTLTSTHPGFTRPTDSTDVEMTPPTQGSAQSSCPRLGRTPGAARGTAPCQERGRGASPPRRATGRGSCSLPGWGGPAGGEKAAICGLDVCFSMSQNSPGRVFSSLSLYKVRTGTLSQDPSLALGVPAFHGDSGYHAYVSEQAAAPGAGAGAQR